MHHLVLRNARIVRPEGILEGDVAVEDGRIAEIGHVTGGARQNFDLKGRALLPGAIDPHVHFRTPGGTHKERWLEASRAAVTGGVTAVIDMPNTDPPTIDYARLVEKARMVAGEARCGYGFWVGAAPDNLDGLARLDAGEDLPDGPCGYAGVKVYLGSTTGRLLVEDPAVLEGIFRETQRVIAVHAEDNAVLRRVAAELPGAHTAKDHHLLRPREAARVAVRTLLALAGAYTRDVHVCHMTTQDELDLVREGPRAPGTDDRLVTFEVCPHHLAFDERRTHTHANFAKMNPPLREPHDRRALWQALASSHLGFVATDHAPHTLEEKEQEYDKAPSGVPGVETMLRYMLYEGPRHGISLKDVAWLTSQGAADRFGIVGKGRIEVGYDADLVVASDEPARPLYRDEVLSRCGWNPFEGEWLAPPPAFVFVGGQLAAQNGQMVDERVRGGALEFGPSRARGRA